MLTFTRTIPKHSRNSDHRFKIFYFGIISYPRYLHIAKKAVDIVNQKGRDAKLIIAGNIIKGDKNYVEKTVLGKSTEHIPWIELSELGKHIVGMDACISPIEKNPQHESGVANKVFQYMFFSKPLLVSNCEPQKRLVESVECGLSYDHESAEELAEKIIWLMDNPDKAKEMGENGRKAILNTYNTDVYGKKIIDLYESVLRKRSAKS
ncbi:MAG: glycosyltransferase [Flavobacteriales bacterium]|nr:glycosyltransferase [Flavobacteriales bacterium]